MGTYNRKRFMSPTLPRKLIKQVDDLREEGESRAEFFYKLIGYWKKGHPKVKTKAKEHPKVE